MAFLRLKTHNLNQSVKVRQHSAPPPVANNPHVFTRYSVACERGHWYLHDKAKNRAACWSPGEVLYLKDYDDACAAAHDFNLMDSLPVIHF